MKWTHEHPTVEGWYRIEDSTNLSPYATGPHTQFARLFECENSPTGWAWEDDSENWDQVQPEHITKDPKIRYAFLPYPDD